MGYTLKYYRNQDLFLLCVKKGIKCQNVMHMHISEFVDIYLPTACNQGRLQRFVVSAFFH
jgi:hypothetical protein